MSPDMLPPFSKWFHNNLSKVIEHPDLPGILSGNLAMPRSAGDSAASVFSGLPGHEG